MIKAVLFDLDGTLLPMDQEVFTKGYFGGLVKKAAPSGYEPQQLIQSVWTGTKAMFKNDGSRTNEEVFWSTFADIYGEEAFKDKVIFDEFYRDDFDGVKVTCGFNPKAAECVKAARDAGLRVALATNPIFPQIATEHRMRWAGLAPQDFEICTTYENSRHCKPNPEYYLDICRSLKLDPEDCLMVGNDVTEDMIAESIGMKVFLLTDNLINKENADISKYPNGNFDKLSEYIRALRI